MHSGQYQYARAAEQEPGHGLNTAAKLKAIASKSSDLLTNPQKLAACTTLPVIEAKPEKSYITSGLQPRLC